MFTSIMARGTGATYYVDDAWRKRAEARLLERDWSRADLAREAKCPKSTITELLDGKRDGTTHLPKIHAALGWPPPPPLIVSVDASEMFAIWDKLDDMDRGRALERLRTIFEARRRR